MSGSLFRSGIRPRLLAALGFAVLVFAAVRLLDRPGASTPPVATDGDAFAPVQAASPGFVRIDLESVAPVAEWLVRLGDAELHPTAVSPTTWETEVTILPEQRGELLSVITTAAAPLPAGNAMRMRVFARDTARTLFEQTHWCDGADCVFEISLQEVTP